MTGDVDYEKILRAYLRHVDAKEGTDFLPPWEQETLVNEGLTVDEAERLIALGEQENGNGKVS